MSEVARAIVARDAITPVACGMVTSLGTHVAANCAAARAGISRASLYPWTTRSPEDGDQIPLLAHAVCGLTGGFEGQARLVRLAELGLRALLREVAAPATLAGLPLYLSLPHPLRFTEGFALVGDPAARDAMRESTPVGEDAAALFEEPRKSVERAWSIVLGQQANVRFVSHSGHTGFAECLGQFISDADASNKVGAAVIGGIDTFLTAETLEWLELTGRLKTSADPAGLMPGEAAVFVLVQRRSVARREGSSCSCCVAAIASSREPKALLEGKSSTGEGLAEALFEIRAALRIPDESIGWCISDRNGEYYRAVEWGSLLSRLLARGVRIDALKEVIPALSFGETGAASGAISLAMAWRGIERGYAQSPLAILLSTSEGQSRAVVAVARG